ncbi:hypothetical protein [Halobacterium litoreum]|uniref:Uncharacterized protein n=1 Tax=Halobacterium litoreum TaxID=2039234 RepID=A0ABD5NBW0_9EURY|nr:hypothetical protein [Halobacterium litoreum]UHH14361.1 hypothetical protein LT972_05015 [Halobacterium litoreum]
MDRSRFVTLSFAALAAVVASFVVLGFSRLVLPYRTARLLAAPVFLLAVSLAAVAFAQAVLVASGRREFE